MKRKLLAVFVLLILLGGGQVMIQSTEAAPVTVITQLIETSVVAQWQTHTHPNQCMYDAPKVWIPIPRGYDSHWLIHFENHWSHLTHDLFQFRTVSTPYGVHINTGVDFDNYDRRWESPALNYYGVPGEMLYIETWATYVAIGHQNYGPVGWVLDCSETAVHPTILDWPR